MSDTSNKQLEKMNRSAFLYRCRRLCRLVRFGDRVRQRSRERQDHGDADRSQMVAVEMGQGRPEGCHQLHDAGKNDGSRAVDQDRQGAQPGSCL